MNVPEWSLERVLRDVRAFVWQFRHGLIWRYEAINALEELGDGLQGWRRSRCEALRRRRGR